MNGIFDEGFLSKFPEDKLNENNINPFGLTPPDVENPIDIGQPENVGRPDNPGYQSEDVLANLPEHPEGPEFDLPEMPPEIGDMGANDEEFFFGDLGPFENLPDNAAQEARDALSERMEGPDIPDPETQDSGMPDTLPGEASEHVVSASEHIPMDIPVDVPVV